MQFWISPAAEFTLDWTKILDKTSSAATICVPGGSQYLPQTSDCCLGIFPVHNTHSAACIVRAASISRSARLYSTGMILTNLAR